MQTHLARFNDRQKRWFVIGAVSLIGLPLLALLIQSHRESSLTDEWAGMRDEVGHLEQLQGRIRQFRPWFEPNPQTLGCMEALVSCFPENGEVWAKSVQFSETGKVTCNGFSRGHSAILGFQDQLVKKPGVTNVQLQQERGSNPVQFTIVFQWEGNHVP